jgi:hypothetical protein
MSRLNVSCDCVKCGGSMQQDEILSNDDMRARILFKCYQCDVSVVVNRWWEQKEPKDTDWEHEK